MILYKMYQGKNTKTNTNGKWYARTAPTETVSLDALAQHMSNHNTPYSKGAIKGVLQDMVSCIKELILEGKQVKIPDLGIFTPRMSCLGAEQRTDFSVQTNVKRVYVGCRGTGELAGKTVKADTVLREYGAYAKV